MCLKLCCLMRFRIYFGPDFMLLESELASFFFKAFSNFFRIINLNLHIIHNYHRISKHLKILIRMPETDTFQGNPSEVVT